MHNAHQQTICFICKKEDAHLHNYTYVQKWFPASCRFHTDQFSGRLRSAVNQGGSHQGSRGVAVAGRGGGGECTLVLAPDWLTGFHHQLLLLCPWGRDEDATVEHRWDCNSYTFIFFAELAGHFCCQASSLKWVQLWRDRCSRGRVVDSTRIISFGQMNKGEIELGTGWQGQLSIWWNKTLTEMEKVDK